jgi:predicted DNA-binding protein (MmcQ/YjbR family)
VLRTGREDGDDAGASPLGKEMRVTLAMARTTTQAGMALRKVALSYPEVHEDFPWGERALKVKKKVFLFLHFGASELSLSVKLPQSHGAALMFPFALPTAYGLGKAGWVTARFPRGSHPPLSLLEAWLHESYQAVAPAKLAALVSKAAPHVTGPARQRRKPKA